MAASGRKYRGQYLRACGCLNHDVYRGDTEKGTVLYHVRNSKQVPKCTLKIFIQRGLISTKSSYLCTECISFVEKRWKPLPLDNDRPNDQQQPHPPPSRPAETVAADDAMDVDPNMDNMMDFGHEQQTTCTSSENVPNCVPQEEEVPQVNRPLPHVDGPDMDTNHHDCVKEVIDKIKNGTIPPPQLRELAAELDASQAPRLLQDTNKEVGRYKDIDNLVNLDVQDWVEERNPVLVSFLGNITTVDTDGEKTRNCKLYALSKAIDQVHYARNANYVSRLAFSENLLTYSITNSKFNASLAGSTSPAGSYRTILKWIDAQSQVPSPIPTGDLVAAFDNNQVLSKNYRVRLASKVCANVITNICYIQADKEGQNRQTQSHLKPSVWRKNATEAMAHLLENLEHVNNTAYDVHRRARNKFISERLDKVYKEQLEDGTDAIDASLKTEGQGSVKVCPSQSCGAVNTKAKIRNCQFCGTKLLKENKEVNSNDAPKKRRGKIYLFQDGKLSDASLQDHFEDSLLDDIPTVILGDPVNVNPNSFDTLRTVLRSLGQQAGIKRYHRECFETDQPCGTQHREWISVFCDGQPYTILQSLINDEEEFGWVLLRPGGGHFEMNMARSFIELNWEIFMKELAVTMGFRSDVAQAYAKKGSDHHKSWDLLQIAIEATADELLLPYVRSCVGTPTRDGYYEWLGKVESESYLCMAEMIFTYGVALQTYRLGMRLNRSDLMLSGRRKFAPVWFIRNHPKYRKIETSDLSERLMYPSDIETHVNTTETFSCSGNKLKGESPDFVLENRNKRTKYFVPPKPNIDHWRRSCNNEDKLTKIREATLRRIGTKDPSDPTLRTQHDLENEKTAWRKRLRSANYFSKPFKPTPVASLTGEDLDSSLMELTVRGKENEINYLKSFIRNGRKSDPVPLICVTKAERAKQDDIWSRTKEEIAALAFSALAAVEDTTLVDDFASVFNKSVRKKKKEYYVDFYNDVMDVVKEVNNSCVEEDDAAQVEQDD